MAAVLRPRFYYIVALALAVVIVTGFARTYYLRFLFDQPPLKLLLHAHGLAFTAWLALFVVQTRLIAAHNYRLHMKVGIAGAVLAAAVVVIGVTTALIAAPDPRLRPMGFTGLQFLTFPLTGIVFFGICVATAIALRRRADLHKRLMVLAMFAVLGPPVARLIRLVTVGEAFLLIQTLVVTLFVAWALLHDWIRNRIVHPVFAIGGTVLILSWPARAAIARTDTWVDIARWMTS